MKDISHILAPMHEQSIKDSAIDVMIQSFFEIFVENFIVFIDHCKHLNKRIITFWRSMEWCDYRMHLMPL